MVSIKASMEGVSVVVCCYNSARVIQSTLHYLANQSIEKGLSCELIVIDNKSEDNTAALVIRLWQSLGSPMPITVYTENKVGLSYAREKGLQEAKYSYVIFCDDDNWLAPNYIQKAYEIMSEEPTYGVLGGIITAAFEVTPPMWFNQLSWTYAVGAQAKSNGDITNDYGRINGAGMVIRKSVWGILKKKTVKPILSDRKGNSLTTGGDTELCWQVRMLGYKIGYSDQLRLTHFMTKERLNWQYCRKLQRGIGKSLAYLSIYDYVWNVKTSGKELLPEIYWTKLVLMDVKHLFKSLKRLYFFTIRDIEGEFYICNYEHSWGRLTEMIGIVRVYRRLIRQTEKLCD